MQPSLACSPISNSPITPLGTPLFGKFMSHCHLRVQWLLSSHPLPSNDASKIELGDGTAKQPSQPSQPCIWIPEGYITRTRTQLA